jgi:putative sterol carrier protein
MIMVRQQLQSLIQRISLQTESSTLQSFNFDLYNTEDSDRFHILLDNGELMIRDGLLENSIGLLRARERSINILMKMGSDLINSLLELSFKQLPDSSELPEIATSISASTELEGKAVNFNISIQENQLRVIEEDTANGDIRIRIKASYLPKLFSGKVNFPMALITGKIKIENKSELFKLLARLGLKF